MSSLLLLSTRAQSLLLTPSPVFGFPWMDVLGIPRLSFVLDQVFRAVNQEGRRPTFAGELLTILTLVFGGETLLSLLHPSSPPPSWLLSSTPFLLFGSIHLLVTRTPLQRFIPRRSPFWFEALMAPLDALGRTVGLCTFVVEGLLSREELGGKGNWWMVGLMSWIGMYGGGLLVNLFNMFSISWEFQTPPEFKPYGWLTQDFWIPPVFTLLYLHLTSPRPLLSFETHSFLHNHSQSFFSAPYAHHNQTTSISTPSFFSSLISPPSKPVYLFVGSSGQAWSKEDARALVGALISGLFLMRTCWTYREELLGWGKGERKGKKSSGNKVKTQ